MKTSCIFCLALLIILATLCISPGNATDVSGNIVNQTWTKAGSPYHVVGDVFVASLTINPGVNVLFETNAVFRVGGRLTAAGTAEEPIHFTRTNSSEGWQGIFFDQNPPGSELTYCHVEKSVNSGVRLHRSTPIVRGCVIANNSSPSIGGGLEINTSALSQSLLILEGCTITNNSSGYGGGAYAVGQTIKLLDCVVRNNRSSSEGGGGLLSGTIEITGCVFGDNQAPTGGGLSLGGTTRMLDSAVTGNSGGAITIVPGTISLTNCIIAFNDSSMPGIRGYSDGTFLANCTVVSNRSDGVQIKGGRIVGCLIAHNAGGGLLCLEGLTEIVNTAVAHNGAHGISISPGGSASMLNDTIAFNPATGLRVDTGAADVSVRNSILYFNQGSIAGAVNRVEYSCVEGGHTGTGNVSFNPLFEDTTTFRLLLGSPAIDGGDPAPEFNDTYFPPSQGSVLNDMGIYGGPEGCRWALPPFIRRQPQDQLACAGQDVTFCIKAVGEPPLRFQWLFNGGPLEGETNECLTLTSVDTEQAGGYSARVSNQFGTVTSSSASLAVSPVCFSIQIYAGLTIHGIPGHTYRIDYTTDLRQTNQWQAITNLTLPEPETLWIDTTSTAREQRFYNVVPVP